MINTIFYFPDSLTFLSYQNKVGNEIAYRTIVFAKEQNAIYMGGKQFGTGNLSDLEAQILELLDDPDVVNKVKNIVKNYFDQNPIELPTASTTTKGGIKVGGNLYMDGDFLNVDTSSIMNQIDGIVETIIATKVGVRASTTNYGVVKIKYNGGILVENGEISIDPTTIPTVSDVRGISSIDFLSTSGLVDTYQITYTDNLNPDIFTVTNGAPGIDGLAATITVGTVTTLPAGYSATVTNSGTPSAAILNFGIPKGHDGSGNGNGDGGETKYYELAFKTTTAIAPVPSVPANGFPNANDGWKRYAENTDGTKFVWMCTRLVNGSGEALESWNGPWLISGPGGQPGEDGKGIEFIYTRTYDNSVSSTLSNALNTGYGTAAFQEDDYIPSGWYDNPSGVDIDHPYEWTAVRTSDSEGIWSQFVGPILWSHYGQNGMDGDGVEYIFYANTTGSIPVGQDPSEWSTSQTSEYTGPSGSLWTDDPWDLETLGQGAKEWVSIRKKIDGVWGTFSAPALWATFARDGVADGYTVDLTNENMPVGTTSEGGVTSYSNSCGVQVFHNGSPITNFTISIGTITRSDSASVGNTITATANNSTKEISVSMSNVTNFAAVNAFIPVTVSIADGPTRNITITLFGIATGQAGSAIDLWTNASAIRTNYEQTVAVPAQLLVGVKVSSADTGVDIYAANGSDSNALGFSYKYYYDDNSSSPTSLSSGNSITIAPNHNSITVQMIYNSRIVDSETIPFVKDGAPYIGAGPIMYNVNVLSSSCRAYKDANGDPKYDGTVTFSVTKRTDDGTTYITTNPNSATGNDNERISVTIGGYTVTPSYRSGSWTASISSPRVYIEGTTESFAQIVVTNGSSTVVASQVVPFAIQGNQGPIGVTGRSKFKSTCFIRTNVNIESNRPTGGSYADPIPTSTVYDNGSSLSWSDGIPAGEKQLWATTRSFTSDGAGQDANWEYPRKMTDTTTYDVEFALEQDGGGIPNDPATNNRHKSAYPNGYNGQVWFDPVEDSWLDFTNMCWRAERVNENGEWSGWTIVRIKGEKGDQGIPGTTTVVTQPLEGIVMRFRSWSDISSSDYIEDGTVADSNGVKFMDVVYTSGGSYYRIKTRKLKSLTNAPETIDSGTGAITVNTAEWVQFAPSADAAFQNIIARNAFIQNLTGREIIITDGGGNPVAGLTSSQAIVGDGGEGLTAVQRGDIRIWAGSPTVGNNTSLTNCPFRVTAGGELTATNAAIFGSITATSGYNTTTVSPTDGIKQTVGSTPTTTNWLKQDGSGQLAKGNVSWNTSGSVSINGNLLTGDNGDYGFNITSGSGIATLRAGVIDTSQALFKVPDLNMSFEVSSNDGGSLVTIKSGTSNISGVITADTKLFGRSIMIVEDGVSVVYPMFRADYKSIDLNTSYQDGHSLVVHITNNQGEGQIMLQNGSDDIGYVYPNKIYVSTDDSCYISLDTITKTIRISDMISGAYTSMTPGEITLSDGAGHSKTITATS